ncbi:hypothetical protein D9M68_655740 [compost metagenome]
MDAPVCLWYRLHALMHLPLWRDALAVLVPSKDINARIRRILDQADHALMSQAPPDEPARPSAAVGALGKAQATFGEALDDRVCAAGLVKQAKRQLHGAAHLVIGIQDDVALVVIAQPNRERKAQLTLLRLVELAALEAPAQKVQFGLCHRAFEAQQQAVVEVARVVAPIGVDDQGTGERAQLEQAMPVQVRARQARDLQRKHGAHVPHRDIRHQRLEILAARHLRA